MGSNPTLGTNLCQRLQELLTRRPQSPTEFMAVGLDTFNHLLRKTGGQRHASASSPRNCLQLLSELCCSLTCSACRSLNVITWVSPDDAHSVVRTGASSSRFDCHAFILSNANHLPRDFHLRLVGFDCEALVFDFAGDNRLRELSDHRELIAKVSIARFKVVRQCDDCFAVRVSDDVAVADARHVA